MKSCAFGLPPNYCSFIKVKKQIFVLNLVFDLKMN